VAASNQQAQNIDLGRQDGGVIGLAGAPAVLAADAWHPHDAARLG
jgi:hypothetical protein